MSEYIMHYKNFIGHIAYDTEAKIFHGQVSNIKDVITFQGKTLESVEQALKASVDDYIEFCNKRGELPDKTMEIG